MFKEKHWSSLPFIGGRTDAMKFYRRLGRRNDRHRAKNFCRSLSSFAHQTEETEDGKESVVDHCIEPQDPKGYARHWMEELAQKDHLGPLYRFVDKMVGRPWDEAYSIICRRGDYRSVAGDHLQLHFDMIERNPVNIERYVGHNSNFSVYYVDDDGIIRYAAPLGNLRSQKPKIGAREFCGVDEITDFLGRKTKVLKRMVIHNGAFLYWGYRNKFFSQGKELTPEEYKTYNSFADYDKKYITHQSARAWRKELAELAEKAKNK